MDEDSDWTSEDEPEGGQWTTSPDSVPKKNPGVEDSRRTCALAAAFDDWSDRWEFFGWPTLEEEEEEEEAEEEEEEEEEEEDVRFSFPSRSKAERSPPPTFMEEDEEGKEEGEQNTPHVIPLQFSLLYCMRGDKAPRLSTLHKQHKPFESPVRSRVPEGEYRRRVTDPPE